MNSESISSSIRRLIAVAVVGVLTTAAAWAQGGGRPCSVESIAGNWMFATDVGQRPEAPEGREGDITAIGTMNIDAAGAVNGVFNGTISGFTSFTNITYSGTVTVDPDCRGTLAFVTSSGAMRTDSIAVLSQDEIWAMSQEHDQFWTYRVQRISRSAGRAALAAKIDALLRRLGLVPGAFDDEDE